MGKTCPHCGYCDKCGRSNSPSYPIYPYWPYWHYPINPWWNHYSGGSISVSGSSATIGGNQTFGDATSSSWTPTLGSNTQAVV